MNVLKNALEKSMGPRTWFDKCSERRQLFQHHA
jgi:hypothetical protein